MRRLFPALLLSGIMLLSLPPVSAAEDRDTGGGSRDIEGAEDMHGRITVRLTDGAEGTSKTGVWLSCTKAAELSDGNFVLTDACFDVEIDLNSIENAADLEYAARRIAGKNAAPDCTVQTDAQGTARFEDLSAGVYLIQALNDSGYDEITPFLVPMPVWSETEGTMVYDVAANPKHTPRPDEKTPGNETPRTGDAGPVLLYTGAAAALLGAAALCRAVHSRRRGT